MDRFGFGVLVCGLIYDDDNNDFGVSDKDWRCVASRHLDQRE